MILALDLGNTRAKIWLLQAGVITDSRAVVYADLYIELGHIIELNNIAKILIASVLSPQRNNELTEFLQSKSAPAAKWAKSLPNFAGLKNGYLMPTTCGVDRWLAMLGARQAYKGACIVISAGTALTVDCVNAEGIHLGGYISPGYRLFVNSLLLNTDLVRADGGDWLSVLPGKKTTDAVSAAFASLLCGLVGSAREALGKGCDANLIVNGGDANMVMQLFPEAKLEHLLILNGLLQSFEEKSVEG